MNRLKERQMVEIMRLGPGTKQTKISRGYRVVYFAEGMDMNRNYGPLKKKKYFFCSYRDENYLARPMGQSQTWRIWILSTEEEER